MPSLSFYLSEHWPVFVGTKAAHGTGNGGGGDSLAREEGGGHEAKDLQGKEANKELADDAPAQGPAAGNTMPSRLRWVRVQARARAERA